MTKIEIAQKVARKTGFTIKQSARLITAILDTIKKSLTEAGNDAELFKRRIEIRGFGTFRLRHKNPRLARNPRTGEQFMIGDKWAPYFKPSKTLKALLPIPE
jgi:integration host factor subunit beta